MLYQVIIHGDCWCPGTRLAPGHLQPPGWLSTWEPPYSTVYYNIISHVLWHWKVQTRLGTYKVYSILLMSNNGVFSWVFLKKKMTMLWRALPMGGHISGVPPHNSLWSLGHCGLPQVWCYIMPGIDLVGTYGPLWLSEHAISWSLQLRDGPDCGYISG